MNRSGVRWFVHDEIRFPKRSVTVYSKSSVIIGKRSFMERHRKAYSSNSYRIIESDDEIAVFLLLADHLRAPNDQYVKPVSPSARVIRLLPVVMYRKSCLIG